LTFHEKPRLSCFSAQLGTKLPTLGTFAEMIPEVKITKIASLKGHSGSVYALEESLSSNEFFSGSGDKVVARWDSILPGDGQLIVKTNETIYSLCIDTDRNYLLVGQAAGGVHVLNLENNIEERLLQNHQAPVFDITFSKKNKLIFTLSGDGELGILNSEDFTLLKKLFLGNGKLRSVAINFDESIIVVGAADGSIFSFSLPEMQPIKHWQAHQEGFSVNALTFSPDGKHLLSGSRDAHLHVYDVQNDFECIKNIPAHNYAIYSISFSPDGTLFATGSRDKTIKIWDAISYEVINRIDKLKNEGHVNSVNKILWHKESGHLITASDDRSVMVWKIENIN